MKTNKVFSVLLSFSLLIIGVIILSSCKKDRENNSDDNGTGCTNCFTYVNGGDPQTVKIQSVYYLLDDDEMTLFFRSATSEMIAITLKSDQDFSGIREGTYTAGGSTKFTNAVHTEEDGDKNFSVNGISRQISITKSGNNYKISFDFTSGVGLTKGYYTGKILQSQRI